MRHFESPVATPWDQKHNIINCPANLFYLSKKKQLISIESFDSTENPVLVSDRKGVESTRV